jgi:hypothetical protein
VPAGDRVFRSKVGISYVVVLVLLIAGWLLPAAAAVAARRPASPLNLLLPSLAVAALVYLARSTKYIVTADTLVVQWGPFSERVAIDGIYAIRATWNPLSAPALSMDRLEVRSQQRRSVLISPADKRDFVAAILARNPRVTVEGDGLE